MQPDIEYHPDYEKYLLRTACRLAAEPHLSSHPLPDGFPERVRGPKDLTTIPIDSYSREELAIIYAGISSHVGSCRGKRDGTGAVLAHIKDLTISHVHEKGGIGNSAYTTDKQVFHTDVGDLIALMALEVAETGSISRISSGAKVYNELAAKRPDLIHTLSQPWVFDTFGGDPGYTTRPVLYYEDDRIIIQYSCRHFTGYGAQKRNPSIPPITEAQAEALDTKGDIQYINSLGLLHARDAFCDSKEHTCVHLSLSIEDAGGSYLQSLQETLNSTLAEEQRARLENRSTIEANLAAFVLDRARSTEIPFRTGDQEKG